MSRVAWGAALLLAVVILVSLNLRGGSAPVRVPPHEMYHEDSPELADEVKMLRARVKALEERLNAKIVAPAPLVTSAKEDALIVSGSPAAATQARSVSVEAVSTSEKAMVVATTPSLQERKVEPTPKGMVPRASYWSDLEVKTAGGWCRKPPPYAMAKPVFPKVDPGTDKPLLTAELAKKHASKDNMLIATYVNYNRLDFAYTFIKHLRALNNPHFLVGALDEKALRGLQQYSVPTFLIESGLTTNDYGWGTYAFRQLGLHKVNLVLNLAKTGVDCLTVDADAFILRDPFPYIRRLPDAEVLTSSDHLVATNGYKNDGLEGQSGFYSAFNIGYIWIKASSVEFVQKWRDACFRDPNAWDQVLFASVLRRGGGGMGANNLQKMFKKSDGTNVMAGVLPVSLFAS
eukprot:3570813-Prymnesium_polylepis.1